ncbi:putative 5-formyltetrahydrofolate cyclo-ligase [Erysiphe necator]|uniref:5-formyltetrahydrofolate cyclo-ligase n=1 Tax=Uncinula necator TaxID=52586 RepID=A0A0B1P6Z5_UNCNE|nr:putative 5-formyltetrahydrofolate cyclo-ligase [Erysiphe necator]
MRKKQLRLLIKQKLSKVTSDSIKEQSFLVTNLVTKNVQYQNARRIGIYLSMPVGEVQTDSIVRDALKCGKQVFIPYIYEASKKETINLHHKSSMDMVKLNSLADYESLQRDRWGIPVIDSKTFDQRECIIQNSREQNEGLDIIFVPGVAFQIDPRSNYVKRLGHGKGYYDSFLHQYHAKFHPKSQFSSNLKKPPLYGLSLKEQFLPIDHEIGIPMETHDHSLYGLMIGDGRFYEKSS